MSLKLIVPAPLLIGRTYKSKNSLAHRSNMLSKNFSVIVQGKLPPRNPKKRPKVYVFYLFLFLTQNYHLDLSLFLADHPIKLVDVATTAAAKKKPAPSKKAATIQIPVASPTPMVATFVPVTLSKQPRLKIRTAGNISPPQKCIKKRQRRRSERFLWSQVKPQERLFQTFLSLFLVLVKGLQNPPLHHATNVYPALPGMVKPIVAPLVEGFAAPRVVVSPIVGPAVATIGEAATLAKKNLPQIQKRNQ